MQEEKLFNIIQEFVLYPTFFGSRETLVNYASIIDMLFELKYARAFVKDQCSKFW